MMVDTIYVNGIAYHAHYNWDNIEEAGLTEVFDDLIDKAKETFLEVVEDENGNPIPKTICLCSAYNEFECVCGAWSGIYDEEVE